MTQQPSSPELTNVTPIGTQVYFENGCIQKLTEIVQQQRYERTLMVVDQHAFEKSGAASFFEREKSRFPHLEFFTDFQTNPQLLDVVGGVEVNHQFQPDSIIAIGGGTALDLGKLIAYFSNHQGNIRDAITGKCEVSDPLPLIAVPTTAGTGSESTHFAVVYVDGVKHSVADQRLLPAFAIVDPELTHSLPHRQTVATGLDAFCQAVESIWSVGGTDESIAFAAEAVQLAFAHLIPCAFEPNPASRTAMARAAHLSGKAINISKTTASHALSYAITSRFGYEHGIAVAMTLSQVLRFNSQVSNSDCNDPRGVDHVLARLERIANLLGADHIEAACKKIQTFLQELSVPSSIAAAGITDAYAMREIATSVNVERLSNNPRQASTQQLIDLLGGSI